MSAYERNYGEARVFILLGTGASAAAGIAAINSLGNLSGFAGPYAMGYLKDLTGNFMVGLLMLAGALCLARLSP
jgi:hypothetical protein